jgi:twitching motility protein PilT
MRVVGELKPMRAALPSAEVDAMLLPLLNPAQRQALQDRGYADLAVNIEGAGRLRANISRQRSGLKGTFRLILQDTPTIESLGLPKDIAKVTNFHQGLIVIAGPNGHGKTTTLAAIVDLINSTKAHHILTIEEPVEFPHARKKALMSQRDVGTDTRSFAAADVIVIGELRDRETVEIAMTAAETGHLVMATMSTPSAAKTIDRLIDLFPPEDQSQVRATLAGALKFIVAQRLLPSASGNEFVAAIEMLSNSAPLSAMIRDNKLFQLPNLQQRGRAFGIIRFDDSLVDLARAGRITEETALKYAEGKKEFMNSLHPGHAAAAAAAAAAAPPPAGPAAGAAKGMADIRNRVGGLFGKKEP